MESSMNSKIQNKLLLTRTFKSLGTDIRIILVIGDESQREAAEKDLELLKGSYAHYSSVFSRFNVNSELSRINSSLDKFIEVSDPMGRLIVLAGEYYRKTQGLFDPRIIDALENSGYAQSFNKGVLVLEKEVFQIEGKLFDDLKLKDRKVKFKRRMDFSGIAKGFINDEIVRMLRDKGWKKFMVDSGGDIYFAGLDQFGKEWTVDIEGIDKAKLVLQFSDMAVATSGISRRKWEFENKRFHHLINPNNSNEFSFDLKSVTVISDSTVDADVWAKALFLMGKKKGFMYAKENLIPAIFLDYNGRVEMTSAVKKYNFYQNENEN